MPEATALRERLDVRALRRELDTTADRHGFARVGALLGDIGAGYSRNTTTDRATRHDEVTRGWELELPLPLFDWGGVAAAGARAQLQHSSAQLRNAALQARSEARTGWLRYRTAWDLAQQQRTEVLPLRPADAGGGRVPLQRHVGQRVAAAGPGPRQHPSRGALPSRPSATSGWPIPTCNWRLYGHLAGAALPGLSPAPPPPLHCTRPLT